MITADLFTSKTPGTPSETEPLNTIHVENQDQNEDTSDDPVLDAVVVGWSHLLIATLPTYSLSSNYVYTSEII